MQDKTMSLGRLDVDLDGSSTEIASSTRRTAPSSDGNMTLRRGVSESTIVTMDTCRRDLQQPRRSSVATTSAIQKTIHQIARDGDLLSMKSLFGSMKSSGINALNADRFSPLHYAARYNHLAMVKWLVEKGAIVNMRGEDGLTPLHLAARYRPSKNQKGYATSLGQRGGRKHPSSFQDMERWPTQNMHETETESEESFEIPQSIITYLSNHNADVNQANDAGLTPLHYAVMRGNVAGTADLLRCRGINVQARETESMTPLHLASIYGNSEITLLLIKAGADLQCRDRNRATPLHRAAREGNYDIVQILVEEASYRGGLSGVSKLITCKDNRENTALHLAVENCHHNVVTYLIAKGADVNAPGQNAATPLHSAAVVGDVDLMKILLCTADMIDCVNANQETPLHRAAEFNRVPIIELLINEGANVEARNGQNFTPLIVAASHGHVEAIECLLRNGANMYAIDKDDRTAIYWATKQNRQDALTTLLKDPRSQYLINRPDRCGNSPLHMAAMKGYFGLTQCLLEQGAHIDQKNEDDQMPLHFAAKYGRNKIIRDLMRNNKQILNCEDEEGNTPLHLAALAGHENVIRTLVQVGANVEARNSHLLTPLDCAASRGWINAVRVLLECNSPIDAIDRAKTTPLHLAAAAGSVEVVMLLLEWGATVSRLDDQGRNCLESAIENSQKDVAMAIIQSSHWLDALRCKRSIGDTPLRKLIKKAPEAAEEVFNRCTRNNRLPIDHPQYTVTFDYEFLEDGSSGENVQIDEKTSRQKYKWFGKHLFQSTCDKLIKENHPLMIMVRSRRQKLLAHPLCISLIHSKWVSFGRYVYYTNLLVYLVFVAFVTAFVLSSPHPSYDNEPDFNEDEYDTLSPRREDYDEYDLTDDEFIAECPFAVDKGKLVLVSTFSKFCRYLVLILATFHLFREVVQIVTLGIFYVGVECLMEWACYITSLLLVINFSECTSVTSVREPWQWQVGAIAIFLVWINLVLFIRKLPYLGIYVVMFTDVFRTFCKVCIVFFFFIVAFGLGFHTVLYYEDPFAFPGKSIVRGIVMMLGELEFDELFEDEELRYPVPTYFLIVIFMVLICIITMNLLVGLAVDDIKTVQEQANLKRLAMQVELVLNVEGVLPKFLQQRYIFKERSYMPNRSNQLSFWAKIFSHFNTTQTVSEALLAVEKDDMEKIQECQEMMATKLAAMASDMSKMEYQNGKMKALISSIARNQGIIWEDDEVSITT